MVAPVGELETRPRVQRHERCAAWLEGATDPQLIELLSNTRLLTVGHSPVRLPLGETVFAKLVPMTALELAPENRCATANIFGLPARYHYRIGSCGFGAWRELDVHRLANEWVLSDWCDGFPLLHHWRMLPLISTGYDDRRNPLPWGDSPRIRERIAAIEQATSSAVLFLEHVPLALSQWFREEIERAPSPLAVARRIEEQMKDLLAFVHGQGVLHLDAHFDNVLTDGRQLYLGDYGLSLSRGFDLGSDEEAFFEEHRDFDLCTAINSLVHAIVTYYDPAEDWRQTVRVMTARRGVAAPGIPAAVRAFVQERAPLVLAVGDFYKRLLADHTTTFPATTFRELLETISLG